MAAGGQRQLPQRSSCLQQVSFSVKKATWKDQTDFEPGLHRKDAGESGRGSKLQLPSTAKPPVDTRTRTHTDIQDCLPPPGAGDTQGAG